MREILTRHEVVSLERGIEISTVDSCGKFCKQSYYGIESVILLRAGWMKGLV